MLVASLGLLFARSRDLEAPGALESSICRETAFLFNNLFLVAITFTILLGTIFPLIAEAAQGSQISIGAPYFNRLTVPIGFALLFLMGVGPVLPWGAARLEELQYRLLGPVVVGVGAVLLLLLLGMRGVGALVTFGLAAFVLAVTLAHMSVDVRVRRRNTGERFTISARRLFRANPRRYGGYLAHIGILLIIVGIAASQTYGVRQSRSLHIGESMSVDGYRVTFAGWRAHPESNRMAFGAAADVSRGGRSLGTFVPTQNLYFTSGQNVPTPAVREEPLDMFTGLLSGRNPVPELAQLAHGRNPFEDVYLVLQAYDHVRASNLNDPRATATLQVLINPMVGFIWLGGLVVGLGGLFALVPSRRRRPATVESPEWIRAPVQPEEAPV